MPQPYFRPAVFTLQMIQVDPRKTSHVLALKPGAKEMGLYIYTGWWYTYPPEKYESQIASSSQLLGKIKKCSKPPTSIV